MVFTADNKDSCTIIIKNLPLVRGFTGVRELITRIHYFITARGGLVLKEKGSIFLPLETSPDNHLDTHTRGFGFIKLKDRRNAIKLLRSFEIPYNQELSYNGRKMKLSVEIATSQPRRSSENGESY